MLHLMGMVGRYRKQFFSAFGSGGRRRIAALFLFAISLTGVLIPPASVYAATQMDPIHHVTDPAQGKAKPDVTTPTKQNFPGAEAPKVSTQQAAADARPTTSSTLGQLGKQANVQGEALQSLLSQKVKVTPHELTDKRTANSSVSINSDGTLTEKRFFSPKFFKKDGTWKDIDTTLIEDKNAGDAGTTVGKLFGQVESWFSAAKNYVVKDNEWQARFSPSDSPKGMVRVQKGLDQIGFSPVNAQTVTPVISTTKNGQQMARYVDLWPGVTVEYVVQTDSVKENIILQNKDAANKVSFKVLGANLAALQDQGKKLPGIALKGAANDQFNIAPANLILNNFGFVSEQNVFSQTFQGDTVTVSVDKTYLQNLPDKAFPAVVDPGVFYSNFGTRGGGNFVSMKTDGYNCPSSVCNLYAGALYDSNYNLQYWRGAFYTPYDQFRDPNTVLANATLHLSQRSNESFWTGTWDAHTYYVGHATCLNNFGCLEGGAWNAAGVVNGAGDINVTGIYQTMISRGDFGAWLLVGGEDGSTSSYKNFDPGTGGTSGSYVAFTYGGAPSVPSFESPTQNQVYVDPQASLKVSYMTNPNGATPLKYQILVSTGADLSGGLIASGLLDPQQWTVPDGVLQDGSTYYASARSYDPITGLFSNWGTAVPFRIDMRTGKDKTQTYDNFGPVDVDLATGNLTTSAASHTSTALGGSLGISMDYNTPLKSRTGLVAQYWNVSSGYPGGRPTTDPVLTRIDQTVDFDWNTGSPATNVNSDWFYGRWSGYFVAPKTGAYYFGGQFDDALGINVNNTAINMVAPPSGNCYTTVCYGNSVTLQAGQVVPINVEFEEATSPSYAHLYVKGAVDEKIVPAEWLQTGVRPVPNQQGLLGRYFFDDGTHTFPSDNSRMFMQRNDSMLNFNWGYNGPISGGPVDHFMTRWSGYFTAPTTGAYYFGTESDDGSRIYLNGSTTAHMANWNVGGYGRIYGSTSISLTAGQTIPISVEYFENDAGAYMNLWVKGAVSEQLVPSSWLSTSSRVLPDGWTLGIDADGSVSYDHLTINQNSVVLLDSSGSNHEYAWTGSGYKPPVNEDSQLVRNADGTFTLQDIDGRIYVFSADGTLASVTSPVDDRKPGALKYDYENTPAHIKQITDGVDSSRWAKVYYSGNSACGSAPSGFDTAAPSGMLCALKTNDNRATYFYYKQGQLARVASPGNVLNDYFYESVLNENSTPMGYRLAGIRDSLAMDAIGAGVRANDDNTKTQITYDALGRAIKLKQPAATTGGYRVEQTLEFLPGQEGYVDTNGVTVPGYRGATQVHVTGDSEPQGFARRIEYDKLYRTTRDIDNQNLATVTEWDSAKDLLYSTTDPVGMKSTNVYDDEDRPIASYGPAPKAWFDTTSPKNQVPLSSYTSQVARSDAAYDEGIVGPAVAWYDYTKQASNTSGVLSGAPKLHTTGINTATPGTLSYNFTSPPITPSAGAQGIGLSATGRLRLPNGIYTVSIDTTDGARLSVDDRSILSSDQWVDSTYRTITSNTFTVNDSVPKRFRLDLYRKTGSTGTLNVRIQQQGGFAATTNWSSYLQPDYGLPTTAKVYDAQLGNLTTKTNYGSNPELTLAQSSSVDPTGLNLTASTTYETQGATNSFLRQTTKTLPGNPSTNPSFNYTYYGATETRDNPCTTAVEAYRQAGALKFKAEADPDGTGPQTGRVSEVIYDDAGQIVAFRFNADSWSCITYDSRSRVIKTDIPAFNGEAARSIQQDYAVAGDPMEVTKWDGNGWIVVWTDLLGRTIKYRDVHDDETVTTYDNYSRITQRVSPLGTEAYQYDTYGRITNQKLDNTIYSTTTYGSYGQIDHIDYPAAGQLRLTVGRDNQNRGNSATYRLGDGTTTVSDTLTRSQSGRIQNDVVQSGSNQLWSTFGYDGAGRLTSANIGPHTYSYGYGTQNTTTCGTGSGTNPNSGKNGNRTTQTIDGVTTTYCYDYADRLQASSDPSANYAEYDSHGNMTYLGTGTAPLRMCYDASDRNWCLVSYDASGNGAGMYYSRDADGRIIYREKDDITAWNWALNSNYIYGYTGSGDTPDFVRDTSNNMVEKTLHLQGGVLLTIKPQQTGNAQKQYSLSGTLGHTLLTTDAAGTNTSNGNGPANTFTYDPFGNVLAGSTNPGNTLGASYGYGGPTQRITETSLALKPMLMGARIYLPTIGRFTSTDPVEGGGPNNYAYVTDPINSNDYSGQFGLSSIGNWVKKHVVIVAAIVIIVVAVVVAIVAPELIPAIAAAAARAITAVAAAAKAVTSAAPKVAPAATKVTQTIAQNTRLVTNQVSNLYKSSLEIGKAAHEEFYGMVRSMAGKANQTIDGVVSRVRPDGQVGTKVMELKPANLRGVRDGEIQLREYMRLSGKDGELWLYNQNADGTFNFWKYADYK